MISIVFVICIATVSAVLADTNAVVATMAKRQSAASASVVAVAPIGDTAFDKVVKAELTFLNDFGITMVGEVCG